MGLLDRLRSAPGDTVPATATVLWLAPTAKGRREAPCVLRLRVMPPDGQAYEVEHETVVPHDGAPVVGDSLRVRISPHDPTRIEIDWSAQPTAGAAEALGSTPVGDGRQSDR